MLAICIETSLFAQNYVGTVVAPSGQTLYYLWDTYEQKAIITHPNWGDWSGYTMPAGNLIIPDSITHNGVTLCVSEIAGSAFINCIGLTSVTIPDEVGYIGTNAFQGCTGLTSAIIGRGVEAIQQNAFQNCTSLSSITFNADSCYSAGAFYWSAFDGCNNITNFIFGNHVKTIPAYLCKNLTGLTAIVIPDSVVTIGQQAFAGCTNVTTVTLGSGVKSIEINAFPYTYPSTLTRTNYTGSIEQWCNIQMKQTDSNPSKISHNLYLNDTLLTHLVVPPSVDTIRNFEENTSLSSVIISNGVKAIGNGAFSGCSYLTSASIPNSVTYIGDYAFWGSNYLTFNIPDSIIYIGEGTLKTIDSLVIPSTVTHIGNMAFTGGDPISKLVLKCSLDAIVSNIQNTFSLTSNIYDNERPRSQILLYGSSLMDWIQNVTIAYSWEGPIYDLYINDTMVTDVVLPDTMTSIKDYAFFGMRSLQRIHIPNSVTNIGKSAFEGCGNLHQVRLSDSIQNIRDRTFHSCGLHNITIHSNVSLIANTAFGGYLDPDTLTILRATPPTLYDAARYEDIHQIQEASANFSVGKIAVLCNAIDTFENSSTWGVFNIIGAKETQPHVYDTVVTDKCYYMWHTQEFYRDRFYDHQELILNSGSNITSWGGTCYDTVYCLNLTLNSQVYHIYDTLYLCKSISPYTYLGEGFYEFEEMLHDSLDYWDGIETMYYPSIYEEGIRIYGAEFNWWDYDYDPSSPTDYIVHTLDRNGCNVDVDLNIKVRKSENMSRLHVVTVENNRNKLIWESNPELKEYHIYRKNTNGTVDLVATIGSDEPGEWVDQESAPRSRSYEYHIRSVDSCDMESPYRVHRTMHLTINRGISNCWNLIWSKYEGCSFSKYYIYRGTSPDNMVLIDQMPAGDNTSYSDYNAPDGDVYYQVGFEAIPLPPDEFFMSATSISSEKESRSCFSNIATNGQLGINDSDDQAVSIYAADGRIHVKCNGNIQSVVFDILGHCVGTLTGSASTAPLPSGVYIVKAGNSPVKKVVVTE